MRKFKLLEISKKRAYRNTKENLPRQNGKFGKPEAIHQSLSFFSIYIFMKEAVYAISHGKRGAKKRKMVKN
jgi:hypothetical protein